MVEGVKAAFQGRGASGSGFQGLGFRGLGFRGLGFRGLGFRGFGVSGFGFKGCVSGGFAPTEKQARLRHGRLFYLQREQQLPCRGVESHAKES